MSTPTRRLATNSSHYAGALQARRMVCQFLQPSGSNAPREFPKLSPGGLGRTNILRAYRA